MSADEMKKLAGVVRGVVKEEIEPVIEQVAHLTERIEGEVIPTLEKHTEILNKHTKTLNMHTEYLEKLVPGQEKSEDDIKKLNKRLAEAEARVAIQAPPELQIIK